MINNPVPRTTSKLQQDEEGCRRRIRWPSQERSIVPLTTDLSQHGTKSGPSSWWRGKIRTNNNPPPAIFPARFRGRRPYDRIQFHIINISELLRTSASEMTNILIVVGGWFHVIHAGARKWDHCAFNSVISIYSRWIRRTSKSLPTRKVTRMPHDIQEMHSGAHAACEISK